MPDYRVCWEIDITADTPLHAARLAREIQTRPGSTATVFDVHDGKTSERIDLEEHLDAG